jgi:hypothetical protein
MMEHNDETFPICVTCGSQWYKLIDGKLVLQHRAEYHQDERP